MESSRGVGDSFVLESPSPDLEISQGDYFREDSWTLGQIGEFSIRRLRGLTANTNKSAHCYALKMGALLKFSLDKAILVVLLQKGCGLLNLCCD